MIVYRNVNGRRQTRTKQLFTKQLGSRSTTQADLNQKLGREIRLDAGEGRTDHDGLAENDRRLARDSHKQ